MQGPFAVTVETLVRSVKAKHNPPNRAMGPEHERAELSRPPPHRKPKNQNQNRRWCPSTASLPLKWIHQLDYATSGVLCIGLSRK